MKKMKFDARLSYGFAIIAFILGWMLTVTGFFMPPQGEVSQSVLWILGQSLAFCGGVCGITFHVNSSLEKMQFQIDSKQDKNNV